MINFYKIIIITGRAYSNKPPKLTALGLCPWFSQLPKFRSRENKLNDEIYYFKLKQQQQTGY